MTTQRIMLLSYIVLGVLVALVFQHLLGGPLASVRGFDFLGRSVLGTDMFWALMIGGVFALGIAVFCWVDPRVKGPATQVVEELQRVTWPTMAETRASTIAVIAASIVCALLLGFFDYGWGYVTQAIYAEAAPTAQTTDKE
jgi:preprotein translocase subunit SecE